MSCQLTSAGTDWIVWSESVGYGHPDIYYLYENVRTGALKAGVNDPGGRIWDNPNTTGLVHTLCSPLRVPTSSPGGTNNVPGPIVFLGRYALYQPTDQASSETLQACGSPVKTAVPGSYAGFGTSRIVGGVASNSSGQETREIKYIELPSLQRGAWKLPAAIPILHNAVNEMAIIGKRIYVSAESADTKPVVYSARLPVALRQP